MFNKILEQVNKYDSVLIFPHTSMDGDSVGSAKALSLALKQYGKNVAIIADEEVPHHVEFLSSEDFLIYKKDSLPTWINEPYLAFAVDCSDSQRIEERIDLWNKAGIRVCIDHHPGTDDFAELIMRDAKSPAAALLVYDFIKGINSKLDKDTAEAIYTGILTDTGAFKYSNTDAKTHRVVAELIECGVDHSYICNQVYDNKPIEQLEIEAFVLENSTLIEDGKAVISSAPYDMWTSKNVPYSYTESSIDVLRSIEGVEVAAILKEKEPGLYKLSMRAKYYADVSSIATRLGGGGHKKAAAATLKMSYDEAFKLVASEIHKIL